MNIYEIIVRCTVFVCCGFGIMCAGMVLAQEDNPVPTISVAILCMLGMWWAVW